MAADFAVSRVFFAVSAASWAAVALNISAPCSLVLGVHRGGEGRVSQVFFFFASSTACIASSNLSSV
jgi:hypothetical protein